MNGEQVHTLERSARIIIESISAGRNRSISLRGDKDNSREQRPRSFHSEGDRMSPHRQCRLALDILQNLRIHLPKRHARRVRADIAALVDAKLKFLCCNAGAYRANPAIASAFSPSASSNLPLITIPGTPISFKTFSGIRTPLRSFITT
jgi:hypothetical protein